MLSFFYVIIPVLINVAFITLLERKILGYSQLRKGPNKVSMAGLPQPFNDAIKLFSKEMFSPLSSNKMLFVVGPMIAISLSLSIWMTLPNYGHLSKSMSMIVIYLILSMNIYPLLVSGWSSNSNYALIGSMRGVAQSISYEISFALIIMFFMLYLPNLSMSFVMSSAEYTIKLILCLPIAGLWLISCVAETNRTPFDFAEGESELVSGFNIEYGSGGFAMIFMAEYASIYFMSILFWCFFISSSMSNISLPIGSTLMVFFWIWLRTTLPRYRYDMLMSLSWFSILPSSIMILVVPTMMVQL